MGSLATQSVSPGDRPYFTYGRPCQGTENGFSFGMSVITLTTDFGTRDWFAGTMKGVIAKLAPEARVIDITHEVPPGDVRAGAMSLAAAAPYFPESTIHVAVVDPGVGSSRRALALRTDDAVFIGPDNGVLSWAVREIPVREARVISQAAWLLQPASKTFHGRDVFAPAAAKLAAGAAFSEAGEEVDDWVTLDWPDYSTNAEGLDGEIIYIDHFGNAITNLPVESLPSGGDVEVACGGSRLGLHEYYASAEQGEALAIAGSRGLLELSINGGDFARDHGVRVGSPVRVRIA